MSNNDGTYRWTPPKDNVVDSGNKQKDWSSRIPKLILLGILGVVLLIGIFTCAFCTVGVKIGNVFGSKFENKAQMAGGIILILLGTKILLEHLGVL